MIDNSKNIKYWEKRALLNLTESEKIGDQTSKVLVRMYNQAYKDLSDELNSIYKNYSNETGLDIQRLKTLLSKSETDKTWKNLEKQGLTKYIKKNYKARINIIEQKQAQIYAKIKSLHDLENPIMKKGFRGVINHSYYKTCYDLQQGTGLNLSFSKLNFRDVNRIANYNWSGVKFSTRALYNNGILADEVVDIIGGALLSGQSFEKTRKQMQERFDVEGYKLERLIRTESNYFHNESMAVASEDMGFKKYKLSATLDERTSKICRHKQEENKVYDYSRKKVGENYPPFHPNCRTIAVPYIDADKILKERKQSEQVEEQSFNQFLKNNDIIEQEPFYKNINDMFGDGANLNEIDTNIQKNIYNRFVELGNEFPVHNKDMILKTNRKENAVGYSSLGYRYKDGKLSRVNMITINKRDYLNEQTMNNKRLELINNNKVKYNDNYATINHEYAHKIDENFTEYYGKFNIPQWMKELPNTKSVPINVSEIKPIADEISKYNLATATNESLGARVYYDLFEWAKSQSDNPHFSDFSFGKLIEENFGKYAKINKAEFFAEGFATITINDESTFTPFQKEFERIFKKYYNRYKRDIGGL